MDVFSGELVSPVALKLEQEYNNPILLPWIGLPGTFGGAIVGNAGCFGLETSQILKSVKLYDIGAATYQNFTKDELDYRYRHSTLKNQPNLFVISAIFDITAPIIPPTDARLFRKDKQPGGWSCGSFFANPDGYSAGKLIDEAGLKGTHIGGIRISERHGNFFLNDGTATYSEVLALKDLAKKTVREKFGVELHEEVRIIENEA